MADPATQPVAAPEPLRRRWFQFSLRTLFLMVAVLSCWLAWNVHVVNERKALRAQVLAAHGGQWEEAAVATAPTLKTWKRPGKEQRSEVSWVRYMIGDRAIAWITVTDASDDEINRIKAVFPEADIYNLQSSGKLTHY